MTYDKLKNQFSWLTGEVKQQVILSSDADGILSELFLSSVFNWSVVGYYDSEILLLKKGCDVLIVYL
jgi:hypothetical protein